MFEREITLYAFGLGLAKMLMKDLREDQIHVQVNQVGQTPAWILGHLCVSCDAALKLMGKPGLCPDSWKKSFGPGTDPAKPVVKPSKEELLAALLAGHEAIVSAARSVSAQALERAHGVSYFENTPLKTVADAVAFLLASHSQFHIGQLSAWRRQSGYPAMF